MPDPTYDQWQSGGTATMGPPAPQAAPPITYDQWKGAPEPEAPSYSAYDQWKNAGWKPPQGPTELHGEFQFPEGMFQAPQPKEIAQPEAPPIQMNERQSAKLAEAQKWLGTSYGASEAVGRNLAPIYSDVHNILRAKRYTDAIDRLKEGKESDQDFVTIADYQAQKKGEEEHPWATGLSKLGSFGGSMLLLQPLFKVLGMGGAVGAEEAAAAAPKLLSAAGAQAALKAAPPIIARAAAQQAIMPSTYEAWSSKNAAEGRSAFDLTTLPSNMAMNTAQFAVGGAMGNWAKGIKGAGIVPTLARAGLRQAAGTAELQAVDIMGSAVSEFLPESMKLTSGYGTLGDFVQAARGKKDWGEAARNLVLNQGTLAMFNASHMPADAQRHAFQAEMGRLNDTLEAMSKRGQPFGTVAKEIVGIQDDFNLELKRNPNMTREDVLARYTGLKEGPLKEYARGLAQLLPEKPAAPGHNYVQTPEGGWMPKELVETAKTTPEATAPPIAPEGAPSPPTPKPPEAPPETAPKAPAAEPGRSIGEYRELLTALGEKKAAAWSEKKVLERAKELGLDKAQFEEPKPVAQVIQPEKVEEPPTEVAKAFSDVFEGAKATGKPGEMTADIAGRTVKIWHDQANNIVDIDFNYTEKAPEGAQADERRVGISESLQPGSAELGRRLQKFVRGLKDTGTAVSYEANDGRAAKYRRMMEKLGYEASDSSPSSEQDERGGRYSWWPKNAPEAAPEAVDPLTRLRAQRAEAKIKPEVKETHTLDELDDFHQSGQPVHIDEAFDAAGLTDREKDWTHAAIESLRTGGTLKDAADKLGTSKQRLGQILGEVAEKLDLPDTFHEEIAAALRAQAPRQTQAVMEGANVSKEAEQGFKKRLAHEVVQSKLDKLTNDFIKEAEQPGGISDERRKWFTSEGTRLANELEAARGTGKPTPVRRETPGRLPGGERPPGPTPATENAPTVGPAQENAGTAPAPAPTPEASGNVVKKEPVNLTEARHKKRFADVFQAAAEAGLSDKTVHEHAKWAVKHHNETLKDRNEQLKQNQADAWNQLEHYDPKAESKIKKARSSGGDWTKIKGFDVVADSLANRGLMEVRAGENPADALWRFLDKPLDTKLGAEGGYPWVMKHMEEISNGVKEAPEVKAIAGEAAGSGIEGSRIEEAIRRGQESGLGGEGEPRPEDTEERTRAESGDTSFGFGAAAGEPAGGLPEGGVGTVNTPAGGFGAAGGGRVEGQPHATAPGAAAPVVGEPGRPMPASSWLQHSVDWVKSFAQQAFPSMTRLSKPTGEAAARVANAQQAAKAAWDYFSNILKIGDKKLGELNQEESRFAGAVWLERRMREYRDWLKSQGRLSGDVGTLVGQEGSPLQTEEDYQRGREAMWSFWEAVKQEWTPEVEKNFKGLMNLEPDDVIDSKSQIPGIPLNAIALTEADPGSGVIRTGQGPGMGGLRIRKPGFTREAGLGAEAYDVDLHHMMQRTLNMGFPAGRRAEFARTAIAEGLLKDVKGGDKPPEGWKYLGLDPSPLPGLDPNARYYAHPDAYKEMVQALGIGERPGQTIAGQALKTVMDKMYGLSLMAPVELSTHIANHFTALFREGMGTPIYNLKDSFANAYGAWKKDPEILRRVMELAKIGASFGHEAKPGLLGEKYKMYDPTAYLNKFTAGVIDAMQKGVRLQLEDAFDRAVAAGRLEGGETNKRNYINQAVGNYNTQAGNRLTQFLKDTGLQQFATAAHTFTVQGAKAALGGAINAPATSAQQALNLRATSLLKLLPIMAIGPVVNYLRWGQAFPDGVPALAVKTRDDDDPTKVHSFDPLKFTGIRRGWRALGINAVVEGAIKGDSSGQMLDHAVRDWGMTAEHMVAGPPVQFAHTAVTGENAMGHKVAEQVSTATTQKGIALAARQGRPLPGSSQKWENLKAALKGINPLVAAFSQADRPRTPRTFVENLMQSAGPFGEQTRTLPVPKKHGKR